MALVKLITCRVPSSQRGPFDAAQRHWSALAPQPGFIAQVGGWNPDDDEACILALWQDAASYGRFMDDVHDGIAAAAAQTRTFISSQVRRLDVLTAIPGAMRDATEAIGDAAFLRIAECRVRPDRFAQFLIAQLAIWNPGMRRTPGFRGGLFTRGRDDELCIVVITGWESRVAHEAYRRDVFPALCERADPHADLEEITGRRIDVVRTWRVVSDR